MQGDGREHRNDAERIYSEESSDVEILYQFQSSKAAAVHRPHQDEGGMHKEEKNAEDSYVGSAEPNDSIHIVMSANMIGKNHQDRRTSQEIEICGVSATCVIGHSASPPSK
jgi:hypothetical protein